MSSTPILLKRPVSIRSVSYHGELATIDLTLEFCQPYFTSHPEVNKIVILSDCESAITTVSSFQYPSNFAKVLCKIYDRIKQLSDKSIDIEILWIAAHTGIIGNDLADQCAKHVAKEAAELGFDDSLPLSFTEVKKEIENDTIVKWQRQWDRNEQCSILHNVKAMVSTKSIRSSLNSNVDKCFNSLITGHSNSKDHRWRMNDADFPACSCGNDSGTVEHFLLFCPQFNKQRKLMTSNIFELYNKADIPPADRSIDLPTLLGPNNELPKPVREAIRDAVFNFIYLTSSDISI